MSVRHSILKEDDIHNPFTWIFDNKSQFYSYFPTDFKDINKLALIRNSNEIFILKKIHPYIKWDNMFEPFYSKDVFLKSKKILKVEYNDNNLKSKVYYDDFITQNYYYNDKNLLEFTEIYFKTYLLEKWQFFYNEKNLLIGRSKIND